MAASRYATRVRLERSPNLRYETDEQLKRRRMIAGHRPAMNSHDAPVPGRPIEWFWLSRTIVDAKEHGETDWSEWKSRVDRACSVRPFFRVQSAS